MAPNNSLVIHGNEKTMNLNTLLLTNIQSSSYFKVHLYEFKTYHQVVDEIYYKVTHLEPWEKGSRKTSGQTGMCGGVRGVGAGGIVSSAFCLLYKLFTLRLTRKQVIGLITHADSPYIRGLGFMYIRYTQPPSELWEWYEEYLEDDEEIDVKAGGGHVITIGEMVRQFMSKLEWYATLFPRIPVPVEKTIHAHFKEWDATHQPPQPQQPEIDYGGREQDGGGGGGFGEAARMSNMRGNDRDSDRGGQGGGQGGGDRGAGDRSGGDRGGYNRDYDRGYDRGSTSRRDDRRDDRRDERRHDRHRRSRSRERRRSRERHHHHKRRNSRSRSRERSRHSRHGDRDDSFDGLLRREQERQHKQRYHDD